MSRFGNYEKEQIYTAIREFVLEYRIENPQTTDSEVVKEIMEAVSAGLEEVLYKEY